MITKGMFSNNSDEWATPQKFYDDLNEEFHFTLDPCATEKNTKCKKYYTKDQDGLQQDWSNNVVFVNPPYSQAKEWVQKCYWESKNKGVKVVMLIPARTDTRYFHDFIYGKAEIRFIKGRLKFNDSKNCAPFPSMIVIYGGTNAAKLN